MNKDHAKFGYTWKMSRLALERRALHKNYRLLNVRLGKLQASFSFATVAVADVGSAAERTRAALDSLSAAFNSYRMH